MNVVYKGVVLNNSTRGISNGMKNDEDTEAPQRNKQERNNSMQMESEKKQCFEGQKKYGCVEVDSDNILLTESQKYKVKKNI